MGGNDLYCLMDIFDPTRTVSIGRVMGVLIAAGMALGRPEALSKPKLPNETQIMQHFTFKISSTRA